MKKTSVGILHPGAMGASIAASAVNSGYAVYWASEGRSPETRARAEEARLRDMETLETLVRNCSVILSVCPPHAAESVADEVRMFGFQGIYLDANAIAPERAKRIEKKMTASGVAFVDGGIVGGPAWKPKSTWLYLSGPRAGEIANCFSSGPLEVEIIGAEVGMASGLKMCTAANVKGAAALFMAVLALSEKLRVREPLIRQWSRKNPDFEKEIAQKANFTSLRAWRFIGEMDEIAATFAKAGLPRDFHAGARNIYERLEGFKGAPSTPPLEDLLQALLDPPKENNRPSGK